MKNIRDIRRTRKQSTATIMTMTGFLELDKFYELTKEDSVLTIREVEMKVRPDIKIPVEPQKVT